MIKILCLKPRKFTYFCIMEWFESWFDTPYYHILYKNHDYQEAESFISKLVTELGTPRGAKIIDLACGKGRHSVYLNNLGFNVLGLDLSKKSIDFNKQFEDVDLHFEVHDMRDPIQSEKVDAVFNLFTSFGYFDSEEDDKKVFQSVAEVLPENGVFVLDYLNENYVRENLVPEETVTRGDIQFFIHKKIENNFIVKDIQFEANGQKHHYFERVKLHTPEQINAYAEEFGFERIKVWGDYQLGDFIPSESPRCINWFRKRH